MIIERFFDAYISSHGSYYEIFINPSKKELIDVDKESQFEDGVRFFADPNHKEVYAISADVLHMDFSAYLSKKYNIYLSWTNSLSGIARNIKGNWVFVESDFMQAGWGDWQKEIKKLLDTDWNWVNKYILVDEMIENLRNQIESCL